MKTTLVTLLLASASFGIAQTPLTATEALALAAKNRPALRAAKVAVEQARAASRALGAYAPTTIGIGASTRSEVGATDQDLFASQPIDLFGRQSASRRLGNASFQLALAEYVAVAGDLQNEILTTYSETVAAKHQKEVSDELLKISEEMLSATKRRFDQGNVAEIQVTRASIEFERAKQSADLHNADLRASLKRLAGLLGIEPSRAAVVSDALIQPLENLAIDARPDLLNLKAQVQIAESEAGVAKASNRPELTLQLVRSPWSSDRGYFVGRAQLTWPIFDHGRSRSETRASRLKAEAANKLLEDAASKAKREVEATQAEIAVRQDRIKSYEGILSSARDLVAKSQKAYIEGFGTQMDVLEATRALREVEQELVEARQQLSLAVIAQFRATGFLAEVLK